VAHTRQEVAAAVKHYLEVAAHASESGDWAAWADLFTVDADYFEHAYGRIHGRDQIFKWISGVMGDNAGMSFPVDWSVIEGDRVVMYQQMRTADPEGGDAVYQFPAVTILTYAGDGRFSYEEDMYNTAEAIEVSKAVTAARERAAAG
jgi:ketosteroid isomerase-like protein